MGATPTYAFPFPGDSDAPDIPADIEALAVALEAKIAAVDLALLSIMPAAVTNAAVAAGTMTGSTFTAALTGGTTCSVVFTAPTSGKVLVLNAAELMNTTTNYCACAFEIRTGAVVGSGSVVLAASFDRAVLMTGTSPIHAEVSHLATGLTPGAVLHARQLFSANAGTGTFSRKSLTVLPVFA